MLRQFTLQPNEDKKVQFEGQFLVVTQATGPVEFSIGGTTPITVDEKDRIHLRSDSPNDRAIRLKNISGGVNEIEIHTSDLLVDKRTGTDIKNAIQIADDQRVGIDPTANIVQAVIQNPIKIDPAQNAITIQPDQCVGIDPNKNQMEIKQKQKAYENLPTIEFIALPGAPVDEPVTQTLAANPQRDLLILTADSHNLEPIWIGGEVGQGVPLLAGERMFLEGNHALDFAAMTHHVMYAAHVVWVV